MPDSKTVRALEKSAEAVLQQHKREVTGSAVRSAFEEFLEIVELYAVSDWKTVEKYLTRVIRPILDNNYAFQTMRAIREHYAFPNISYSAEFSWAPRGLLMYGLSAGLQKCEADQPENLPPRIMLQWLSLLTKDELHKSLPIGTHLANTARIITHVLFSLWSCRYDGDAKGRKIKILIALRKLDTVEPSLLVKELNETEPGSRRYASLLILIDYYWLRSWARLAEAGYLPQIGSSDKSAPVGTLPTLANELIQDFDNLQVEIPTRYWVEQKFSVFALEILQNVASEATGCQDLEALDATDKAFLLLFDKFLVHNPRTALEAVKLYKKFCNMPLSTRVCDAVHQSFTASCKDLPLLVCLCSATENISFIDKHLADRVSEILDSKLTEADVSGIILATRHMTEYSNWRTSFFERLRLLPLSEACPGRLTWLMVGRQLGVPIDVTGMMALWQEIVAECDERDWPDSSMSRFHELDLELITLTAADVLLGGQLADADFDRRASELHTTLSRILSRTERGQERIALLCLCLSIYLGSPQTKTLIDRLSIRAIQSYSLAWCLDGMERLWKTNIWTAPRQTCESPERVRAQSGSVALLTLDAGSLQSMVTQIEASAPRIEALISSAREYSATVDAVTEKRPGWKRAAAKLVSLVARKLPAEGDFTPLRGKALDDKLSEAAAVESGLAALTRRLLGYHLAEVTISPEKLSYPTVAHVYLERLLHGEAIEPAMRAVVRERADVSLLASAERVIMMARAVL